MMLTATADVDADLGRIAVATPYTSKEAVKAVPGARWNVSKKIWTVPLSWTACLALRAEFGKGLTIGDELRAWASDMRERKESFFEQRNSLTPVEELPELPGFEGMFEHQMSNALLIQRAVGNCLILDETGTGKTRGVCAGLALLTHQGANIFPAMIIAPKSVLINWQRELEPYFPDKDIRVVQGTPAKMRDAIAPGGDIYVMGWGSLRKYSRMAPYGSKAMTDAQKTDKEIQALGLRTIVADEIHRAKSCEAQQTRCLWAAADPCSFRIGLTGTPVQETPDDLYGILRALFPTDFPTKTSYRDRWISYEWNLWGGLDINGFKAERKEEFFKIFDGLSRRLTKEVVLPFLPDKIYERRWVDMLPKQRRAYEEMKDDFVTRLESSTMAADSPMVQMGRLLQLANSMGDLDADGKFVMTGPSPKIDAFLEDAICGDFDGHQVVVFSDSRELLDLLEVEMTKAKLDFVVINGDVTGADRQAAIDIFQEGKVQYCLLSRAGGEGITLTAADIMVRLTRPWSYTTHTQVEDRVHRIGAENHDSVTYIDYFTRDSVEIAQDRRREKKGINAQEVLRDDEILEMLR